MEMETEFQANRRISISIAEIFSKHVGFPSSVLIGAVSLSEIGLNSEARSSIVNEIQSKFQVTTSDHSSFTTIQDLKSSINKV